MWAGFKLSANLVQYLLHTSESGQMLAKTTLRKIFKFTKGTNDAAKTIKFVTHPAYKLSHLKTVSDLTRGTWGGGARKVVRGKDLLVRPPGREMLSTLHPGKGSLRSSGPICSRRGK